MESAEEYRQRVYVYAIKPSLWFRYAKPSVLFYVGVKQLPPTLRGEHANTLRARENKVLQILADLKERLFQDGGEYYVMRSFRFRNI